MKDSVEFDWPQKKAYVRKDDKEYILHGVEIVGISFGDEILQTENEVKMTFYYKEFE